MKSKENLVLSIIIPAYNEEKNIGLTLDDIAGYLSSKDIACEVIVVDDGSTDGTVPEALTRSDAFCDFRVIKSFPNRGKGYVVRKAMLEAIGKYVMFMDADNSTPISEVEKFLKSIENGCDAAIGSRRMKESEVMVPESAARIFLGNIYMLLSKLILGISVSDFNCGFKMYRRCVAERIFCLQKMDGWCFDVELILIMKKLNMHIEEIPVRWSHEHDSKVRPIKAGFESFTGLVRIKLNDIRGIYG